MYQRSIVATLSQRMSEPRRFLQILIGPRQTGKTTAVTHISTERWGSTASRLIGYVHSGIKRGPW